MKAVFTKKTHFSEGKASIAAVRGTRSVSIRVRLHSDTGGNDGETKKPDRHSAVRQKNPGYPRCPVIWLA